MPRYQVTAPDGRTVTLEGDTPPTDADLEGIFASLPPAKKSPTDIFKGQLGRMGSFGAAPTQEDIQASREANVPMLTLGAMTAPAMAANPLAALKGLGLSLAGGAAGGYAGKAVGGGLEAAGAPSGTSKVLGTAGGLAGGFAGPMVGPQALMKLAAVGGGRGGMLSSVLGKVFPEGAAVSGAAEASAAKVAMVERALAIKEAESAARIADRARLTDARIAQMEARAARSGTRAPRAASKPSPPAASSTEGATALQPDPDFIDPSAVKVLPFQAKGTVKPATNLGGVAKAGPTPTPDDKLAETLQASIDAVKAKKAGAVSGKGTPLLEKALDTSRGMHQREATAGMTEAVAARRKAVGSQVVARELGMGRHEVQSDAGTILNEALGEVSPVIPEARWADIVTKMKSLPPSERVAYVARARGVKNMAQIENLRRTLETLGLLLPIGVAAGVAEGQ